MSNSPFAFPAYTMIENKIATPSRTMMIMAWMHYTCLNIVNIIIKCSNTSAFLCAMLQCVFSVVKQSHKRRFHDTEMHTCSFCSIRVVWERSNCLAIKGPIVILKHWQACWTWHICGALILAPLTKLTFPHQWLGFGWPQSPDSCQYQDSLRAAVTNFMPPTAQIKANVPPYPNFNTESWGIIYLL